MKKSWKIGNAKEEKAEEIVRRIFSGDVHALRAAREVTVSELAEKCGDLSSRKIFLPEDYKIYLLNRYLGD